jgi:gentisate 1,2-dioxygenase
MSATGSSTTPDHIRKAWNEAHVSPLWEQLDAHSTEVKRDRAYIWTWETMRPLIENALNLQDMAAIQRRVLTFNNPNLRHPGMGATPTLTAALQILKPGEVARPHRHSPSALRFVLEGDGAYTIVDGKECLMNEGDLVITPGWTWHAHEHRGTRPIIWLDSLDVPLHRYFGTDGFEPGPPPNDMPATTPDDALAVASIVPDGIATNPNFSPLFHYPWEQAVAALKAAPVAKDGLKRVRYVNPMNGGPCMSLMDCFVLEIGEGETVPVKSTQSMVCAVVEGTGTTQADGDSFSWAPKDVFTLPTGAVIRHRAKGTARIFAVSDREMLRRLDLLEESTGVTV